jgi:molybdenum cofactor biosynthesis protein B
MSEERDFIPLNIAVLTVSDSRDEASDKSGPLLVGYLTEAGHRLVEKTIVPDDKYRIREVRRHAGGRGAAARQGYRRFRGNFP